MSARKKSATTPNTVKFATRQNAFPDAAGRGEYFGNVVPNGTLDEEGFIDRMVANGCKLGRTEIKYFLNAIGEAVVDEMKENLCNIDLGFCTLRPVIKGAFDAEDAPFDPERHKLTVEAVPSREIQRAVAKGLKGVNVTPVEVPPPNIDSVCQPPDYVRNTISIDAPFEIHGTGLTVEHGDESAELEFSGGSHVPVTLKRQTESDGARRVKAQLAEQPPTPCPKRARLIFRTHGLADSASPLYEVRSAWLKVSP